MSLPRESLRTPEAFGLPMRIALAVLVLVALGCEEKKPAPNITPDPSTNSSAATVHQSKVPTLSARPMECPVKQSIQIDLDEWQKRLLTARIEAARNAALDALKLKPVADSTRVDENGASATLPLAPPQVTIRSMALSKDARDGRIVSVRYARDEGDTSAEALRIQVLRRVGKDTWCALAADELSVDQLATERACLGAPEGAPALSVDAVSLVEDKPLSLRVVSQSGLCGACGRSGEVTVTYYDVTGTALSKLFQHTLYSAHYNGCPWPPVREVTGSVEPVGEKYPREIVAVTNTICTPPMADLPKAYREDCKPGSVTERYRLKDGAYVKVSSKSAPKPSDSLLAIEDSQFVDRGGGVGWGNRCLAHLKASRWANARAACEHGLAMKPAPAVAGALHENLALVEEGLEHEKLACEHLELSMKLRPGNASVEKKLTKLDCSKSP